MAPRLSLEEIAYQKTRINEDQRPHIVGVSVVCAIVAIVSVALRVTARIVRRLRLGLDDWFAVGSLLFTLAFCAMNILSTRYGLGRHLIATDTSQAYKLIQVVYFLTLNYSITHWLIKMCILFTFKRLFTLNVRWFTIAIHVLIVSVTLWAATAFILTLLLCRPMSYFWNRVNPNHTPLSDEKCLFDGQTAELAICSINSVVDIVLLVLPILLISRLQLDRKKKIGVIAIFLVGLFACVASLAKLRSNVVLVVEETNPTWNSVGVYVWTVIEAAASLASACFPALGPIFKIVRDRFRKEETNMDLSIQEISPSMNRKRLSNEGTDLENERKSEIYESDKSIK